MSSKSYASKLLLFGEYSVIQQSNALAMPYHLFEGKLAFTRDGKGQRDTELDALVKYLQKIDSSPEGLGFNFDVSSFAFDVGQGLCFDSTIPQGYGVGSSGALVAALYERYGEDNFEIEELKKRFALIESHFHGSSSGFDPLISYLDRPILKTREKGLECITLKENKESPYTLFLINTGRSRKTEPLVNLYLEKCKSDEFRFRCQDELIPITNKCIDNFLNHHPSELWNSFTALSHFQFEHFLPMIPKLFHDVWREGVEGQTYVLKLCGAGGGGFLMGLTRDFKGLSKELSSCEIRPLFKI